MRRAIREDGQQGGFTLIECLVALAVLAMSAAALIGASETNTARIYGLETRTAARLVAEEEMAGLQLGLAAEGQKTMQMLGRPWTVETALQATGDPDIARALVTVRPAEDDVAAARFTGFVDRGGPLR